MLLEVMDLAEKKKYDIKWFEDDIFEVEPNDTEAPHFPITIIFFKKHILIWSFNSL